NVFNLVKAVILIALGFFQVFLNAGCISPKNDTQSIVNPDTQFKMKKTGFKSPEHADFFVYAQQFIPEEKIGRVLKCSNLFLSILNWLSFWITNLGGALINDIPLVLIANLISDSIYMWIMNGFTLTGVGVAGITYYAALTLIKMLKSNQEGLSSRNAI